MTHLSSSQHLAWGAEDLWRRLAPLLPGLDVEVLAQCDSTNTVLLERARQFGGAVPRTRHGADDHRPEERTGGRRTDDAGPWLLVAEHQTRGRGRLGRPWQSAAGASLTFSLALPLQPADWSGLSLAVGVALADALDPVGSVEPPRVGLKWPNDLWRMDAPGRGRKLGGILIETTSVGPRRTAVIGVGLNVHPLPDRDMSNGCASLQEDHPGLSAPEALHLVALPLVRAVLEFEREGFAAFVDRYAARDLLAGRIVTTSSSQAPEGRALGVCADGALRLQTPQGEQRLTTGEVSVRLQRDE